jgi:energy-converting hydrogenase Eha subunit G
MDMQTAATEAGMVTTVAADTTEVQHAVVLAGMVVDMDMVVDKILVLYLY